LQTDLLSALPQIRTVKEPKLRVQIVSQRSIFDEDPSTFMAKYEDTQK
jgi:magnesium chelatase subunit I